MWPLKLQVFMSNLSFCLHLKGNVIISSQNENKKEFFANPVCSNSKCEALEPICL